MLCLDFSKSGTVHYGHISSCWAHLSKVYCSESRVICSDAIASRFFLEKKDLPNLEDLPKQVIIHFSLFFNCIVMNFSIKM